MRILVLLTDAFGSFGGIAKFNRDLLTALCSYPDCHEVVAVPRLMPTRSDPLPQKLNYVTAGINSKLRFAATAIRTVHEDSRFDLIICGHINLISLAYVCRSLAKAPLTLIIHGIDAWQPTNSWLRNSLVRRIDAFIAVSELTKRRFISWSKVSDEKGFVLPNSIELSHFGPGPKNANMLKRYRLEGKTVLMTTGRLVNRERYKGFDEVIDVLPEVVKEVKGIVYLVVGGGDDRQRLEKKAHALGLADRVVFTGFVPEEEKAEHYRLADAFVMPSRGEGFGIVLLEAMACGVPVIASKVDGSREAIRNGILGLLVNPDDPKAIEEAILKSLKIPGGSVPDGLSYFSFDNFRNRLDKIIGQIRKK